MKLSELLNKEVMSISALARATNLSRPTIRKVMEGKQVDLLTVKKICKYFGKDYKDYLD